jgi:hypothetical protein
VAFLVSSESGGIALHRFVHVGYRRRKPDHGRISVTRSLTLREWRRLIVAAGIAGETVGAGWFLYRVVLACMRCGVYAQSHVDSAAYACLLAMTQLPVGVQN